MEDHEKSTTIVILPKRVLWKDLILFTWVLSFTFVGFYVIYTLFFGDLNNPDVETAQFDEDERGKFIIFLAVFLGFWVYFEYLTLKSALWYLFGKELLLLNSDGILVKRSILSYGKAHRYFNENIKKIWYEKPDTMSINHFFSNAYWALGSDALFIEHKEKKKSFGRRLDEKEAKQLLKFILDRMKKWRKKN